MNLQKEPINFSFDYKKEIPPKSTSKLSKILWYSYISILGFGFLSALINNFLTKDPESFYYESQDIIELSSQVNKDIQKELNSIPLDKLDHSLYEDVAFKNIKEIASSLKKENKNIEFLPTSELIKKAKVEVGHVDKSGKYVRYELTMPYIEKRIINEKEITENKSFIYTIYQARYKLSVGNIEINETK